MRSSRRGKPPTPTAPRHDVDFGHLWRQLRAAGWTSKRPSGIQTEWTYTSPKDGNVLVGEHAVVEFAFRSGLLVEDEECSSEDGLEDVVGDENVGEEAEGGGTDDVTIRPSQIDTSVQLSQNTVNELFGPESDASQPDLSQDAVARAFDLSQRDLHPDEEQRDAAASLHLLSEASGLESEEEDEHAVTPLAAPTRRIRIPARPNADVNVLQDGESSSEYEEFSSGDESDGAGIVDDDWDSRVGEIDEEGDDLSDSDAEEMDQAFFTSLHVDDTTLNKAALQERENTLRAMEWSEPSAEFETDTPSYPGLGDEEARPVGELLDAWRSPLLTLFYFVPKSLWVTITTETNRYYLQQLDKRAEKMAARQSGRQRETVVQIARRLRATQAYGAHEILHVVGLLVARMLCPQKRRFAAHWSMVEDGAIPAGIFGRYMSRDRCNNILRDLHFVDNSVDHGRDKIWKLRPVVDKIQERFLSGWSLPAIFSFDEGVLPATSRRNPTRMFMSDKPHRYGSKLFMLCDAKTAYCHRFEVYVGKRERVDNPIDFKTGAAAVLRNLTAVFTPESRHNWHAVVVDRFYSSVLLAVELLKKNVYVVGTVQTNRLGFNKALQSKRKTRPASVPRGSFLFSRSVAVPSLISCLWWDRKPVYYLCTGSAMTASTIQRKIKRVGALEVGCPRSVNDYQNWMGGVDRHDQLRLQSYSLQMSTRFTKYYKGLFLGFLDLALVNAFLSHKEAAKIKGTVAMQRSEWFAVLQNQLLQLKAEDFAGVQATPPASSQKRRRTPVRLTHTLQQVDDWVTVSRVQKRRQRSCKVCALLRTEKKKSFATTYFCERCSIDNAKCWLCNKIRRDFKGVPKTCFEIWHEDFGAGQDIPASLGKRVVLRRPGQSAGKRKKTKRELQLRREEDVDGGDGDNEGSGGEASSGRLRIS